MKILLTGATGLVGTALSRELSTQGHDLVILSRDSKKAKRRLEIEAQYYNWQPETEIPPVAALQDLDAVVHLAGESIATKRWTKQQKNRIRNSRILSTRYLVQGLLKHHGQKKLTLISASAVGFYGDTKDNIVSEETKAEENSFLVEVCQEWEKEAANLQAGQPEARVVHLRIGLVLSAAGGILEKLAKVFNLGGGAILGNGKQWMSWIHQNDLVSLISFLLHSTSLSGAFNATAPQPVTNREFTVALAKALRRPVFLKVPSSFLRLTFREMADLFLSSTRAVPKRALQSGFHFQFESIESAFEDLLSN